MNNKLDINTDIRIDTWMVINIDIQKYKWMDGYKCGYTDR